MNCEDAQPVGPITPALCLKNAALTRRLQQYVGGVNAMKTMAADWRYKLRVLLQATELTVVQ